jgi:predicted ATPase
LASPLVGREAELQALVGREAELQALWEATDRLRSGIGGIVTVVGEAGIGKSRLVAECRGGRTLRQAQGRLPPLQEDGAALQ